MNFGSKLLLIALTTMHLHTEVNKSLFLPLPLPLIEGFYQNMYLRIIYCIEKQKVKLFGSRLLMTQSIFVFRQIILLLKPLTTFNTIYEMIAGKSKGIGFFIMCNTHMTFSISSTLEGPEALFFLKYFLNIFQFYIIHFNFLPHTY